MRTCRHMSLMTGANSSADGSQVRTKLEHDWPSGCRYITMIFGDLCTWHVRTCRCTCAFDYCKLFVLPIASTTPFIYAAGKAPHLYFPFNDTTSQRYIHTYFPSDDTKCTMHLYVSKEHLPSAVCHGMKAFFNELHS